MVKYYWNANNNMQASWKYQAINQQLNLFEITPKLPNTQIKRVRKGTLWHKCISNIEESVQERHAPVELS